MYLNSGLEGLTKLSYLSYASCGQIYLRMMQGAFMHFTRRYATSILLVCIEIASRRVMPTFTYLPVRNIVEQGESFSTTWKPFSVRWQKHPFHSSHRCSLLWGHFKHLYLNWMKILTWFCLHDKHLHELEVMSLHWLYVVSCRMKAALKILAPVLFLNLWKMLQRASCQAICPLQIQGGRCVMGREKGNGNYSVVDDIWNLTCCMIGAWNLGWMGAE